MIDARYVTPMEASRREVALLLHSSSRAVAYGSRTAGAEPGSSAMTSSLRRTPKAPKPRKAAGAKPIEESG